MIYIFEYSDYKVFLTAFEKQRSSIQKGFRSRLAEVLDCQNAYISQILNSHANFGLEQGLKIARYIKLNELETRYFILMIEYARAGTKELQSFFKQDLNQLRAKHLNIKDRIPQATTLNRENQSIYYSSWIYPTIHMIVTMTNFRIISKISLALRLSEEAVKEAVLFLVSTGLVIEKNGELFPGTMQLHLEQDSPQIRQHHTNWRMSAVQSLSVGYKDDIHYSTVSTLSLDDVEKIKSKFVRVIQEYVETIASSSEEAMYNFNLDFYNLIKK